MRAIPADCVLSHFLSGRLPDANQPASRPIFFPFSFNLSQKQAVNTAFANKLSVIE